jgi:hypothetical protein
VWQTGPNQACIDLEVLPGRAALSERAMVRLRWLVRDAGGDFQWLDECVCRVVGVRQLELEAVADAMRTIAIGENKSTELEGGSAPLVTDMP